MPSGERPIARKPNKIGSKRRKTSPKGRARWPNDERPSFAVDSRGGAALSMRAVTGCPIKMLGTYKVAVKVYPGLTPEVTIAVEPKG